MTQFDSCGIYPSVDLCLAIGKTRSVFRREEDCLMQITLNVPKNLPPSLLQKRLKEFEDLLQKEAKGFETDKDEDSFDAAALAPQVRDLFSQLSHKL